jgi:hypothetical protein
MSNISRRPNSKRGRHTDGRPRDGKHQRCDRAAGGLGNFTVATNCTGTLDFGPPTHFTYDFFIAPKADYLVLIQTGPGPWRFARDGRQAVALSIAAHGQAGSARALSMGSSSALDQAMDCGSDARNS